jgi:hypothetical protein
MSLPSLPEKAYGDIVNGRARDWCVGFMQTDLDARYRFKFLQQGHRQPLGHGLDQLTGLALDNLSCSAHNLPVISTARQIILNRYRPEIEGKRHIDNEALTQPLLLGMHSVIAETVDASNLDGVAHGRRQPCLTQTGSVEIVVSDRLRELLILE